MNEVYNYFNALNEFQICLKTYLLDRYSIRADVPPATPNGSNGFAKRDVNLKKKLSEQMISLL